MKLGTDYRSNSYYLFILYNNVSVWKYVTALFVLIYVFLINKMFRIFKKIPSSNECDCDEKYIRNDFIEYLCLRIAVWYHECKKKKNITSKFNFSKLWIFFSS